MMAADVIEMRVAGNAGEWPSGDERHMSAQADMAEPGIEQKVPVPPPHMPHVAAVERLDPRLMDQRHAIGEGYRLIPFICADAEFHQDQSFSTIACLASMLSVTSCPAPIAVSAGSLASRVTCPVRAVTRLKLP